MKSTERGARLMEGERTVQTGRGDRAATRGSARSDVLIDTALYVHRMATEVGFYREKHYRQTTSDRGRGAGDATFVLGLRR